MTVNAPQYPHPLDLTWPQPGAAPRWRMGRKMRRTLLTVGLLCGAMPCIGIGRGTRARESECKDNLKSLFTGLRVQQSRDDKENLDSIGFLPERGNRYAYFLGPGPIEDRSTQETTNVEGNMGVGVDLFRHKGARNLTLEDLPLHLAQLAGPRGTAPDVEFIALCAGDIDNDPTDTPDIWSIATMDRVINGETIVSGEPYRHVNDKTTD